MLSCQSTSIWDLSHRVAQGVGCPAVTVPTPPTHSHCQDRGQQTHPFIPLSSVVTLHLFDSHAENAPHAGVARETTPSSPSFYQGGNWSPERGSDLSRAHASLCTVLAATTESLWPLRGAGGRFPETPGVAHGGRSRLRLRGSGDRTVLRPAPRARQPRLGLEAWTRSEAWGRVSPRDPSSGAGAGRGHRVQKRPGFQ